MAQGNVGSLLVFDPAKAAARAGAGGAAPGDAVVGIITERGEQWHLGECRAAAAGLGRGAAAGRAADGDAIYGEAPSRP